MLDFGFYNMDCMDGMREFPDNYFDLAIVDPPYGDGGGVRQGDILRADYEKDRALRTGGTWAAKFGKKF